MTTTVPQLDRDRLQKLVGMMSSDNAGERANAALMFTQALGRAGLSHGEIDFKKAPPKPPGAPPQGGVADFVSRAKQYLREVEEYQAEVKQDFERERLELSAENFVRVMESMREQTRLLSYEIAVLQTFVSPEVARIAKSRVGIEKDRANQQRWDNVPAADRTYPTGPGGKPGWVKDKT